MSTAIIDTPGDIICTLQFTMRLNDWKNVRKTLKTNPGYPELEVIDEICDLVAQLEQTFYPKP